MMSLNSTRSSDNADTTTVCTLRNSVNFSASLEHCWGQMLSGSVILNAISSSIKFASPLNVFQRREKRAHLMYRTLHTLQQRCFRPRTNTSCARVYAPRLQLVRTFYCSSYSRDRAVNRTRTNRLGIDTYTARMHCLRNGASVLLHRMHRPRTQSALRLPQFVAYI